LLAWIMGTILGIVLGVFGFLVGIGAYLYLTM
jgi:hypothetical protein